MITTLSTTAVTALIAANVNLEETFPGGLNIVPDAGAVTPAAIEVPEVKVDGRNKEARAHNYAARITRCDAAENASNSKGLYKDERRLLAAILREELGREFTPEEWTANLTSYKACEFGIEGFNAPGVRA